MPSIHASSVERQRRVTVAIDRNQSACATKSGYLVENRLGRVLKRHSLVFHKRGEIVSD